jgi:hypothetical protein
MRTSLPQTHASSFLTCPSSRRRKSYELVSVSLSRTGWMDFLQLASVMGRCRLLLVASASLVIVFNLRCALGVGGGVGVAAKHFSTARLSQARYSHITSRSRTSVFISPSRYLALSIWHEEPDGCQEKGPRHTTLCRFNRPKE